MPHAGFVTKDGMKLRWSELAEVSDLLLEKLFDLPAPITRALIPEEREPYTESQVAVTELINDPQQSLLKRWYDYFTDPMEGWWALQGQAIHSAVEPHEGQGQHELKVSTIVENVEVRSRIDRVSGAKVTDWKTGSSWSYKELKSDKPHKYWDQLDAYAALLHMTGTGRMDTLEIVLICRDWSAGMLARRRDYPPSPVVVFRREVDTDAAIKRLVEKVKHWKTIIKAIDPVAALPRCTDLWGTHQSENMVEPKRCALYCPVKEYCRQYREEVRYK